MSRTLLTTSILLSLSAVFVAGACSLDEGTGDVPGGGTSAGGGAGVSPGGGMAGVGQGAGTSGGMAGTTPGGASNGGMAGTNPGGMGGMAGTAMGGGGMGGTGGASDPFGVVNMKNGNGFALKDSFFLVPCVEVAGHDCLTVQGACPNQGAANFEDKGSTFAEDFQMAGEAGKTYAVTIHVNGVVEGKYYSGGTRRDGNNFATANQATGSDGWHVGGTSIASSYNVFKITVFQKDKTTEVAHYYLNSYPQASNFESHQTILLGYDATFDVPGDGVIRYLNQDSNCRAINNCGAGDQGEVCPSARSIPNEPALVMPTMYGGKTVASMNVVNGAAQPFHAQMIHVVVTKVEAK
jgi:hypothetical protein